MEYLGMLDAAQLAGFGFGQYSTAEGELGNGEPALDVTWQPEPKEFSTWRKDRISIRRVVVPLDGSTHAAKALPVAKLICRTMGATLHLLSSVKNKTPEQMEQFEENAHGRSVYLQKLSEVLESEGYKTSFAVRPGYLADVTADYVEEHEIDLVILSTHGKSGEKNWQRGGVTRKLVQKIWKPILMVQAIPDAVHILPALKHILVALDGSLYSERTLPYARTLANAFRSDIYLLSVPAVPSAADYRAPAEYLETLRTNKDANMRKFLHAVARSLRKEGLRVLTLVTGSIPAKTVVDVSKEKHIDLIMLTSRGRGGLKLLFMGSVADQVIEGADCMVFIMPIPEENDTQSG
jgi:nucleotide-binding universal stress UspA family protein